MAQQMSYFYETIVQKLLILNFYHKKRNDWRVLSIHWILFNSSLFQVKYLCKSKDVDKHVFLLFDSFELNLWLHLDFWADSKDSSNEKKNTGCFRYETRKPKSIIVCWNVFLWIQQSENSEGKLWFVESNIILCEIYGTNEDVPCHIAITHFAHSIYISHSRIFRKNGMLGIQMRLQCMTMPYTTYSIHASIHFSKSHWTMRIIYMFYPKNLYWIHR